MIKDGWLSYSNRLVNISFSLSVTVPSETIKPWQVLPWGFCFVMKFTSSWFSDVTVLSLLVVQVLLLQGLAMLQVQNLRLG